MSMSQHSPHQSAKSAGSEESSKAEGDASRKNMYYKKYARPIMVIVGLATLTAVVIYILGEGLLEEGFESLTYESRTVINDLFGNEEGGNEMTVGGRMEMEIDNDMLNSEGARSVGSDERRLNQLRGKKNRARRVERARRIMEKLHRTEGKNVVIANVGIGNV
jgi:hypothetical protein